MNTLFTPRPAEPTTIAQALQSTTALRAETAGGTQRQPPPRLANLVFLTARSAVGIVQIYVTSGSQDSMDNSIQVGYIILYDLLTDLDICHHTCYVCDGPTDTDCESCFDNTQNPISGSCSNNAHIISNCVREDGDRCLSCFTGYYMASTGDDPYVCNTCAEENCLYCVDNGGSCKPGGCAFLITEDTDGSCSA